MLNYLALTGELKNDPEMGYCGDNQDQPSASFTLAFRTGGNRTGQIRVTCHNSLAKLVGRYLHQGTKVAVAGVLDQQKHETLDGEKVSGFHLIARSLELLETDCWGNPVVTALRPSLGGHLTFGDKTQDYLSKGK